MIWQHKEIPGLLIQERGGIAYIYKNNQMVLPHEVLIPVGSRYDADDFPIDFRVAFTVYAEQLL